MLPKLTNGLICYLLLFNKYFSNLFSFGELPDYRITEAVPGQTSFGIKIFNCQILFKKIIYFVSKKCKL